MDWIQRAARFAFYASLPFAAWWVAARLGWLPDLPTWLVTGVLLALALSFAALRFSPGAIRATLPLLGRSSKPTPIPPGGSFEWQPANAPTPYVYGGIGIRHAWLEPEAGRHVVARVDLDIPDAVPEALLKSATRQGLRAATRAIPGRGRIRARGALEDLPGPESRVRIHLDVEGPGASREWARAAANGFGEGFARSLAKSGYASSVAHEARR